MKLAILTANLGNFDTPVDPVSQYLEGVDSAFHRFTDENFPPITGLTPRLQYRIPKLFGWQMESGYDVYIWLDGSVSLVHPEAIKWLLDQMRDADCAFFKHPNRNTVKEEVEHVEAYLQKGNEYIVSRYKNGLHKEMYKEILNDSNYTDNVLYASTAFIYRNNERVHDLMDTWWYYQSRYFTVDQIALPYAMYAAKVKVKKIDANVFNNQYIKLVSKHK